MKQRFTWFFLVFVTFSIHAATLVVDDDKEQCRSAAFRTISSAVAAANAGDTIRVCPGLYKEDVAVTKRLTFQGASNVANCAQAPDPAHDSIVEAIVVAFDLDADDVRIDGFLIRNSANGVAIHMRDGTEIANSIFLNVHTGIGPTTVGTVPTVIEQNCFRDGLIAIESDHVNNVVIQDNRMERGPGIFIGDPIVHSSVNSNLSILRNTFSQSRNIALVTVADVLIAGNVIDQSQTGGIALASGVDRVVIRDNRLRNGLNRGITVSTGNTTLFPSEVQIEQNEVSGFDIGIFAEALTNSTVQNNKVHDNASDGLSLQFALSDLISNNDSKRNGRDGIRLDSSSDGNTIQDNHMLNNVEHDAHDDSVGPGTSGTANSWINDKCKTENRVGLCK